MAFVVTEPCVGCKYTDCVTVCPCDCFYEGEQMLFIDPDECIDCDACRAECPVEAIFPEDALPEKWEPFVPVNYAFSQGFEAVNALVDAYAVAHNVQN